MEKEKREQKLYTTHCHPGKRPRLIGQPAIINGMREIAYMKEYRIRQAADLLRQTRVSIAEIASQVGYENQSKFASAFRDIMKIAPAEYRKQSSDE